MFHCPLSHQLLRGWALCSHSSTWDTGLKEACKEGIPESQDSGGNCYPAPSGSVTRALASHMPCSRLDFRSPLSWERPWASGLWRQPEDQLLPPPSPPQPSGFSLDPLLPWKPGQGTAGAEVMAVVWEQRRECVKFMHVFPLLQEGHLRLPAPPLRCRRVDVPSNKGAILSQTLN